MNEVQSISCKTSLHPRFNTSKGSIFLSDFDIDDVQLFKEYLRGNYNISQIKQAEFIKTRSPYTKAFIITFSQQKLPYALYIPGDRSDTKVTPFNNSPMLCRKCQKCGHTNKKCNNTQMVCRRYSAPGHTT